MRICVLSRNVVHRSESEVATLSIGEVPSPQCLAKAAAADLPVHFLSKWKAVLVCCAKQSLLQI